MAKKQGESYAPILVIVCPRVAAETYLGQPWLTVWQLALNGTDGLRVSDDKSDFRPGETECHLREHDQRAFLFKQGWTSDNAFTYR